MPKGNSGINRGGGSGKSGSAEAPKQTAGIRNVNPGVIEGELNADDPQALERLRSMAERGEIPSRIRGSGANREKVYEEIDKLYAAPSGVLGDYEVKPLTDHPAEYKLRVDYQNFSRGDEPRVDILSRKWSESARQGAVKQGVYEHRPVVEFLYAWRGGRGGYWYDKGGQAAWEGKTYNTSDKNALVRDILKSVERDFGTPATTRGRDYIERHMWVKEGDVWHISN